MQYMFTSYNNGFLCNPIDMIIKLSIYFLSHLSHRLMFALDIKEKGFDLKGV